MPAPPVLADKLARGVPGLQRFLTIALALDRPDRAAIAAQGVALYEVDGFLAQLQRAGEVDGDGWRPTVREAYRNLLEAAPILAPADPASPPPPPRYGDLPREKAVRYGIAALDDAELLAILLRTGVQGEDVFRFAVRLLEEHDGLVGLAGRSAEELARVHGLGPAKATEVAAAFEVARRLARAARAERPVLLTPEQVAQLLVPDLTPLDHEEVWCLPLDTRSRLIGEPRVVSKGDIDGSDAVPRAFFRAALAARAHTAIAVHNHPTGHPDPSVADRQVTRRLRLAGHTIGIDLVDHLIIGDGGAYCSLRRTHPELFTS